MTRFIMPIVLIGIAISAFFMFTDRFYKEISSAKAVLASYNNALDNYKSLAEVKDKLTFKYNAMDQGNLDKLQKLLPGSIDNIRLILEIEKIASPFGMALKDVKYSTAEASKETTSATGVIVQGSGTAKTSSKDYGIFDLEFSTSGSYSNFISFIKELESNLRILNIASVSFSSEGGTVSGTGVNAKITSPEIYKYNLKIKTYWLKN